MRGGYLKKKRKTFSTRRSFYRRRRSRGSPAHFFHKWSDFGQVGRAEQAGRPSKLRLCTEAAWVEQGPSLLGPINLRAKAFELRSQLEIRERCGLAEHEAAEDPVARARARRRRRRRGRQIGLDVAVGGGDRRLQGAGGLQDREARDEIGRAHV